MELSEEEQFEDFTTASDWELFTAKLEQVLTEWQGRPVEPENIRQRWIVMHEKIGFSDFPFSLSYYKKIVPSIPDPMTTSITSIYSTSNAHSNNADAFPQYLQSALNKDNDAFPPKFSPHTVADYFDVKEFAVLTSASSEPIQNESKLKALLSSSCMALNNTNTNFPIFIQYHHWSQQYYCGIAESAGTRTSFQMIHLKNISNQYRYLSGLLNIFKSKMNPSLTASVGVTAHFFYKMQSWHPKYTFDSFPPEIFDEIRSKVDNEEDSESVRSMTSWNECSAFTTLLPFGSLDDPFQELEFVAGWPYLTEDVVVDSPSYSDLEPMNAPEWYFSLKPHSQAEFRLHDLAEAAWKLQGEGRTVEDVLGKKLNNNSSDHQYVSALERLALANSPIPVPINRVISNVNRAQKQLLFSPAQYTDLAPLSQEQLDIILQFLFPDSTSNSSFPYPSVYDRQPEFQKEHITSLLDGLQGVKSAPMGSLVWRLAVVLSYLNSYVGYSCAVAHLWAELVLELRYRWENSIEIVGLERGSPNSGTCLLNQKLQMLNCCIEKKILREKKENEKPSSSDAIESPVEESEDEEDEFFDCDENVSLPSTDSVARMNKPVGRLRKCGRSRLLKTGEAMYIPVTQDPAPLTEDVVEEQAKILVELGNDAEGSELRAKMMSASLLSDMESFKAANPGAILDDFVRWYSPRDWIETVEVDEFGNPVGSLSARMKVPGNLWLDVWSNAQPVPARRQRRLFDDTREAEKVLHWMISRTLRDVSQLIFPCVIHAVTLKVLEEADKLSTDYKVPGGLVQQVTQLTRSIVPKTSSNNNVDTNESNTNNYWSCVMSSIGRCEKEITQIRSFQQKFPQLDLDEILKEKAAEHEVDGGAVPLSTASCSPPSSSSSVEVELIPNYIKVEGGAKSPVGEVIKEIFHMELARNQNVEPENEFKFGDPIRRVFILKYCPTKTTSSSTTDSQHFNQEETLPQRMSCLLKKDEYRLAGTFTTKTDLG